MVTKMSHGEWEMSVMDVPEIQMSQLCIGTEGYEDSQGQAIIAIEKTQDTLVLFVWADKEQEDPTHRISLVGARI